MPVTKLNGVDIGWRSDGDRNHPVILMIQGLGMPAAAWPPEMIDSFVTAGFRVIQFDNRDIGSSEQMDHLGRVSVLYTALRYAVRLPVRAPYSLLDMAKDALALLDELSIDSAHVLGVSMGGMIAQNLALHAQGRVASLTSIMSSTNERWLPQADARVQRFIVRGAGVKTEAARREYHRGLWPLIGSPDYPHTAGELEAFIERIFAAGMPPAGRDRQTLAVVAEGGRGERLSDLTTPTLVIHGAADPLVPVECGRRTAECIPGAKLKVIPGMGHDLPGALLPLISTEIITHVRDAENAQVEAA